MNTRLQLPNGSIAEVDDLVFRKGRVGVVEITVVLIAEATVTPPMPVEINF